MTPNPQRFAELHEILQSVSEITLVDDMPGPVDVRDGQAIQAMTRKCPGELFTKEILSQIFAKDFNGMKIALYQVIEHQIVTDAVFSMTPNVDKYYLIRFAAYY